MTRDTVIIGGGVIGLSVARELASAGRRVTLLERGEPGREASWAGAGILPPGNLARARGPLDRLRAFSAGLWRDWSQALREETGIDNEYVACGGLTVSLGEESADEWLAEWNAEQVPTEVLDGGGLRRYEPALAPGITRGFRLAGLAQVRNPRHLAALTVACRNRGVDIRPHSAVCAAEFQDERLLAVGTETERFEAEQFCFCTGAWTGLLTHRMHRPVPIVPVRGQIVLLRTEQPLLRHVVEVGKRYLVPRSDGRVLVGATEEGAGFEKGNTPEAVSDLRTLAAALVPELARATVETVWSGLRPGCERGYPFLGRLPHCENAFVAAGHFRAGLQTSPGTGVLMRQLLCGETASLDLEPFSIVE